MTHGIFDRTGLNWIIIKSGLLELCVSVHIGTVLLSVLNAGSIGIFFSIHVCMSAFSLLLKVLENGKETCCWMIIIKWSYRLKI